MQKDIPVFDVEFDDESVWNSISIVDFPAIEENFIRLSKEGEIKFAINEEKRDVLGPVIIKDKLIYRNDEKGEYYLRFDENTIKKMAVEFFRRDTQNNGNVMHQVDVPGVVFYQSFISNKDLGLSPKGFEDVPEGSWFVAAHIDNDDVWELVKNGELRGFSIDCQAGFVKETKEKEMNTLEEFYNYLKNNNINK